MKRTILAARKCVPGNGLHGRRLKERRNGFVHNDAAFGRKVL